MHQHRSVEKAPGPAKALQGITPSPDEENERAVASKPLPDHSVSDADVLTREPARRLASITEVGAGAPEPAKCSVGGLLDGCHGGWCLVRPIPYCDFGFVYGFGYLCRHPEIQRIIARTTAKSTVRNQVTLRGAIPKSPLK